MKKVPYVLNLVMKNVHKVYEFGGEKIRTMFMDLMLIYLSIKIDLYAL